MNVSLPYAERRNRASAELAEHCPQLGAQQIVDSLSSGMTHLRTLLMVRAQDDVHREYGADSLNGISLTRMQAVARHAKVEIEAYACIVVDEEVRHSGYVGDDADWFLKWLLQLRLGRIHEAVYSKRVEYYQSESVEERRLKFVSLLQQVVPESAKAPLILYRLFPRSMRIVPAIAFEDPLRAQELRQEQAWFLPAIGDCFACHGNLIDNGESCAHCGNPLWKFNWLRSD